MFGILVESAPRPRRRRGAIVASVAAHAAVILAGIWASADGAAPPAAAPPEILHGPVFANPQPRAPTPEPPRAEPGSGTAADPLPLPAVPALPSDLGIDVPAGLPPVEAVLGNPFGGPVAPTPTRGSRDDGHVRGLVPGGVIDGRYADKPALPLEGNPRPAYPEALRSAGIQGTVDVEFVIEANGRVRQGSLVLLRSDHPGFAESVRDALPGYRFLPAEVGGRPVSVLVRQRFAFMLD